MGETAEALIRQDVGRLAPSAFEIHNEPSSKLGVFPVINQNAGPRIRRGFVHHSLPTT